MHVAWSELKASLQAMQVEEKLQKELSIFDCADKSAMTEITRVLKLIDKPNDRDVLIAKKALRLVTEYTVTLVEHRELHAFRDVFYPEFMQTMKERGLPKDEVARLKDELFLLTTKSAVKRWWKKWKSADDRRIQREAYEHFVASFKRESVVSVVSPTAQEQCDLKLKNLRERASMVEGEEGKALYEQGLGASSRHDQIRLFKAALRENGHEEVEVVAPTPKVSAPKVVAEVEYVNLTKMIDERFADLLHFVGDAGRQQMALSIIRVLARFGRKEAFIGESYLALNMLRRLVLRDYRRRLRTQFQLSLFSAVVDSLVKVKILIKDNHKFKDYMMSLESHVKVAKTPEAGRVIATILALKGETTNGG